MSDWNDRVALAKGTSIISYLRGRGIEPVSRSGKHVMYKSLWRQETKASLAVVNDRRWVDFGESGKDGHGDLIDLIQRYDNVSMKEAVNNILNDRGGLIEPLPAPVVVRPPAVNIVSQGSLNDPGLLKYIASRKISLDLARLYLTQLSVTFVNSPNPSKINTVIAWENSLGGHDFRTSRLKLSRAPKSYTKIEGDPDLWVLFEGMFSMLSALTYYKIDKFEGTTIILNSLSFMGVLMPFMKDVHVVYSYLDNDPAGDKATLSLLTEGVNVMDMRYLYSTGNDFNDYLLNIKL